VNMCQDIYYSLKLLLICALTLSEFLTRTVSFCIFCSLFFNRRTFDAEVSAASLSISK
jgi:hypothetical protein